MVRYAEPGTVERVESGGVESGGGPLIAVPETVLPFWTGADGEETDSDYDRACEADGQVGLLPAGDSTALVLGDEPASTAWLPGHGAFVRWCAADSEAEVPAGVAAGLDGAEWGPGVSWHVPGPVLLFDAARPGTASARTGHTRVALTPGRYTVRTAEVHPGPETWLHVVQVRHLTGR